MDYISLISTQSLVREGDTFTAHYQVDLRAGGRLAVNVPAHLSDEAAAEVGAQLRELTHALETLSPFTDDEEHAAREELLRSGERFRQTPDGLSDLGAARALIADYSAYVAATVIYLRALTASAQLRT